MAAHTNTNYIDNGSLAKPPRFSRDNFNLWKNRMVLFLEGVDPTMPYYMENGPYVPSTIDPAVPAAEGRAAIPERLIPKEIHMWTDEDKKKVAIDTKARSILSMALPDEVYHSVMNLRTSKAMWDTICVQYEGTTEVQDREEHTSELQSRI